MKELFDAISDKFAEGTMKPLVTGLYLYDAEDEDGGAESPYVICAMLPSEQEDNFGSDVNIFQMQFEIVSEDSSVEEACDIYQALIDDYVDGDLTLANGWEHVHSFKTYMHLFRDMEQPDNKKWVYIVRILIQIQK